MTEREFLQTQLILQSDVYDVLANLPNPPKRQMKKVKSIWDNIFCILRNHTNPKYQGDPKWIGDDLPEAELRVRYFDVLY